jgi:rSAM/selenodomain-associated transferase 1
LKPQNALAVFARTPRRGETKTRLIGALGAEGAMQAHCELVDGTLQRLQALGDVRRTFWVTEADAQCHAWATRFGYELRVQAGEDLGARMAAACAVLLHEGAAKVCLVGTDCPPIDATYVDAADDALSDRDLVLGPAEDGGYGLIAMRSIAPSLFKGISWGGPDVLAETLDAARGSDLDVALLGMIWDVDTPEDWHRYRATTAFVD